MNNFNKSKVKTWFHRERPKRTTTTTTTTKLRTWIQGNVGVDMIKCGGIKIQQCFPDRVLVSV